LISFNARDAVKFGLLCLNEGEVEGNQAISADWVRQSLRRYSDKLNYTGWIPGLSSRLGGYVRDIGYGYMWLSARAGGHHLNYAWGHGGNLIILPDELDMVIVTTADPSIEIWGHIVSYFDKRLSSGFVEDSNNEVKAIRRRCYGIPRLPPFSNACSWILKAIVCSPNPYPWTYHLPPEIAESLFHSYFVCAYNHSEPY
jgi:transposase